MSIAIPFDNSYARLPDHLFSAIGPTPVKAPRLRAYNAPLAEELGITGTAEGEALAAIFSGNHIPEGAEPLAQLYAGHQFGNWNPQLGDGRALLLGEVTTEKGRFDIQLKGSGSTPYSRNGDGRAWLGPVLREYVVSEAMHALGIPTTRALAAVETGESVQRETALPGAILTRVATSHIRVGTFQVLAARRDLEGLTALYEHARDRHAPDAETPLDFLNTVIARQADLIALWMGVGFIHGVMNTDNCAISGETIDYGPCAFMDRYHPMTVFSSIDRQGRYAYGHQPDIITWNMAQLATALLPLMPDPEAALEPFTKAVHAMPDLLKARWEAVFANKLGFATADADTTELAVSYLSLMAEAGADFTNAFRDLAEGTAAAHFASIEGFSDWEARWQKRLAQEDSAEAILRASNPQVIPRNHQIEAMIRAAQTGEYAPFDRLNRVLATPYEVNAKASFLTHPPREEERVRQTFCGT